MAEGYGASINTCWINNNEHVRTVNGAGSSNWSELVYAKTTLTGDDNGTRISLSAVIGGAIGPLVIIVILISTVVMYRRIKQRRLNAESADTTHETSSKHGNPAFDNSDTNTYQDHTTDTSNYQNCTDPHGYETPIGRVTYEDVISSDPGDIYAEI
eukprot:XP_011671833.1 PREDICTED: uncharacterized protein LOC105441903 [Strongylocentrotus purpuratus]